MEMHKVIQSINNVYKIKNILHLGAHLGGEVDFYSTLNPEKIYWFEANPELIPGLKENLSRYNQIEQQVFPYAVSSENKTMEFNLIYSDDRTNTGCSSLLELDYHSIQYPHIKKVNTIQVEAVKIDDFLSKSNLEKSFEFISMDIQGSEFDVLSTSDILFNDNIPFQIVLLEAAEVEMYKGMKLESELTTFMESKGFRKYYFHRMDANWGDMLYVKNIS